MKAWRWHCTTHGLDLLTMQTGNHPPMTCSGLAEVVWPDLGFCRFTGSPILNILLGPVPGSPQPLPPGPGSTGEAGRVATPPLPATRHVST